MSLAVILERLAARAAADSAPPIAYFVPGLWIDPSLHAVKQVDPWEFYQSRLHEIVAREAQAVIAGAPGGDWSKDAVIYNLFPRLTTAFDHSLDGELRIGARPDGWRETGTLLKCIALLPYIRAMGFNTVHLLPITAVGQDGKKGDLGSPYGIRNPYRLDETLDEPALGLSAETLFAGFVEAAHRLGLRVIMEFVLRTSSKDGDWIKDHPDWFYWIKADVPDRAPASIDPGAYGNPIFPPDVLAAVKGKVAAGERHDLPPPPAEYRALFTTPPRPEAITLENGRYIGTLDDGTRVRIPGAYSDWPPDDNQPPWGDVTYLRMYTHPDFNYIAYNTIRMYDARSAQPEYQNAPLWDAIIGVIPHYQTGYGIDGVMIDMGHALPMALKERLVAAARAINPDFAFWDENFSVSAQSRAEGYNAVMGYWLFDAHQPGKVRDMIGSMARHAFPIRFFAASENHNTPRAAARAGGLDYARCAFSLCTALPAMPFLLSGYELGETQPINTGLGFSSEMIAHYPSEKLPLFSAYAFDWTRRETLVSAITEALDMRRQYNALLNDDDPRTFLVGYSDNADILVFSRFSKHGDDQRVSVIANLDVLAPSAGRVVIDSVARTGIGALGVRGEVPLCDETAVSVMLEPGQVLVIAEPSRSP